MIDNFINKYMSGHISFLGITIYGRNAMRFGVDIKIPKYGYLCFRLPFFCWGKWFSLYLYVSKDATPNNAIFCFPKSYKSY